MTRRLELNRDSKPQWTLAGTRSSWEVDLHFALPVEELVDALADWEWTDAKLEKVPVVQGELDHEYNNRDKSDTEVNIVGSNGWCSPSSRRLRRRAPSSAQERGRSAPR